MIAVQLKDTGSSNQCLVLLV